MPDFELKPYTPSRVFEGIGGYYDQKREEADHWRKELERAEAEGADASIARRIEARLEMARYTGD